MDWGSMGPFFTIYLVYYALVFGAWKWGCTARYVAFGLYFGILSGVSLLACILGRESMIQVMFLLLVLFPYLNFRNEAKWVRGVTIVLPFLCFLALEFTDYNWWPKQEMPSWMMFGVTISLLSTAFWTQWQVMKLYGNSLMQGVRLQEALKVEQEHSAILIKAKEEAEAASRLKSVFLGMMSHELRTPLHTVSSAIELLGGETDTRKGEEHLKTARGATRQLSEMLGDMIDMARLRSGDLGLHREPVHLKVAIDSLSERYHEWAQAAHLTLNWRITGDLHRVLDQDRVIQMLRHLLDNAFKFTAIGQIDFELSGDAHTLVLVVKDTGPGVEASRHQQLFESFEQLDVGMQRKFGGAGIGLSLVKTLAELMHAKFEWNSAPMEGTQVRLEIPAESFEPELSPEEQNHEKARRVLVVEDNLVNAKMIVKLLERQSCEVAMAGDGLEGIAWFQGGGMCDLVLMDLQMPNLDGFGCASGIKQNPEWAHIPIVALTANTSEEDRKKAEESGMVGFMTKPLQKIALIEILDKYLAPAPEAENPEPA
jgi:signal transduction histidine kinase